MQEPEYEKIEFGQYLSYRMYGQVNPAVMEHVISQAFATVLRGLEGLPYRAHFRAPEVTIKETEDEKGHDITLALWYCRLDEWDKFCEWASEQKAAS